MSFFKNITCFFILITIVSGESYAQQGLRSSDALDSLFTIRAIKINEIAKSASVARRVGLAKAEEYAFDRLMKKILSAEGVASLPEISIQDKQNMMRGIEIVSERRSNRHYIAEVNIGFEPPEVSQWLADQNIPHVLGAGTGLLVLHVHQEGLLNYLWELDGPHMKAWSKVDFINRLRSYSFPKGELKDRNNVSYQQVINHEINPTSSMAREYALDGALLMVTKQLPPTQKGVDIEYSYYLTDMKLGGEGVMSSNQGESIDALNGRVIDTILSKVDDLWREQLLINSGVQGELELVLPSRDITSIVKIEKAMSKMALVRGWTITQVGVPLSYAHLSYTGRRDQLELALRLAGLSISAYGDKWMLSLREE